jgi:hypothetical protein
MFLEGMLLEGMLLKDMFLEGMLLEDTSSRVPEYRMPCLPAGIQWRLGMIVKTCK